MISDKIEWAQGARLFNFHLQVHNSGAGIGRLVDSVLGLTYLSRLSILDSYDPKGLPPAEYLAPLSRLAGMSGLRVLELDSPAWEGSTSINQVDVGGLTQCTQLSSLGLRMFNLVSWR